MAESFKEKDTAISLLPPPCKQLLLDLDAIDLDPESPVLKS